MKLTKAIIPMAAHRELPLQHVTTGDGRSRRVVALQIEELLGAGIREIALVTAPGTRPFFSELSAQFGSAIELVEQTEARGFGHAVLLLEKWVGGESFLVQVCDHVFVTYAAKSCTAQLIEVAEREECSVSAVQVTAESALPYFGVVGGQRIQGREELFTVETVLEKPTPTVAEQTCMIAGLRQGTYLAMFGTHALTPDVFPHLREGERALAPGQRLGLTESLAGLATRERYLALEVRGHRVDLEGPFGLLRAQLALALHGARREEVLRLMLEEVAQAERRDA
ncbi:MAG TPA: sugar phosphate nucleotidyltransferase [Polyangiaceae bacterium]